MSDLEKAAPKRKRWAGGYVHLEADGSELFIIEKKIGPERFHLSTHCHSEKDAEAELERFFDDPRNYSSRSQRATTVVAVVAGGKPKRRPWPGGYIHTEADGKDLFIIEKKVDGQRFHLSTRCNTWTAAMKQLERFAADPLNYSPAGAAAAEPLRMTAALIEEFRLWSIDEKKISRKWANQKNAHLCDWIEDLAGIDIRKATQRDHLKPSLDKRTTSRMHRIEAIKSFCTWLRREKHLLTSGEDPTLDLPVPQAQPAKWKKRKAVAWKRFVAAFAKLEGYERDCLWVLARTGWHVSELDRFVRSPDAEIVKARRKGTIAVLVTRHKSGEQTRTPLSCPAALAAAERLRARGEMPSRLTKKLKEACVAAKVEPFCAGVMRHSVATWAIEKGSPPAEVAEFLQHKDARTTRRFYADVAVPVHSVKLPAMLRLVSGGR